ncbi:hypothetical protein STRTUCAR8_02749 [Streptomyces turgidiscabies Car8]|uniref:Uncharacterized protein n=1 Tax=Streptomyces turgidiscabies (strain Car8) TaxID=698760 RepID=L7EV82_STRT8|nr:hypothetical protein STRTUCAR8_02749 [Streptomyces turgidiscabies Car8]
MIEPQFGGPESGRALRVRREGARTAAHPGDHDQVGGQDGALPPHLRERCQQAGPTRARHDHAVRDGQDVLGVHTRVGADVVGHGVGVQQHLEAGRGRRPDRRDGRFLERAGRFLAPRARAGGLVVAECLLDPCPPCVIRFAPPQGLQCGAYGRRQLVGIEALAAVTRPAGRAEAERHQILAGVTEPDGAGLVVGVQVRESVPAEGLQFRTARSGPYGGLGGEIDEVRARGGLRDTGRPRVAVPVGVDHGRVRTVGAQAGVVREDDPGVHVEARLGEGVGGLAVRVPGGPVPGGVRPQLTARPALVRGVQHGRVLGGDDAVARVAGGQRARGVVRGGQGHLFHAERGDPPGGVRVAVDVPGIDECGRLHTLSSNLDSTPASP